MRYGAIITLIKETPSELPRGQSRRLEFVTYVMWIWTETCDRICLLFMTALQRKLS